VTSQNSKNIVAIAKFAKKIWPPTVITW